jgi:hypothetical protein
MIYKFRGKQVYAEDAPHRSVLLCGTGSSCASLPYFKGGDDRDILAIGRSVVGGEGGIPVCFGTY